MSTPTTSTPVTTGDRVRQWVVLLGALLAIAVAAIGSGAGGGTPIAEAAGGALSADATLLAPASTAFAIWSVIYAGLLFFAVYQLLPSRAADARVRAVAWWVLASMVLNALWILVIQADLLWASVAVIAALVVVLSAIVVRLAADPPQSWTERFTTDVPMGLYLGWVVVATIANVTSAISSGIDGYQPTDGAAVAMVMLVVAAVLSVFIARGLRASPALSIAAGAAMSWGLWWIALGRLNDSPENLAVGWVAGLASIVALCVPFAVRDFTYIGKRDPLAPE